MRDSDDLEKDEMPSDTTASQDASSATPAPSADVLKARADDLEANALEKVAATLETLEAIASDHTLLATLDEETKRRLQVAAGRISRPGRNQRKALRRMRERNERVARKERDNELLRKTGIREGQADDVYATPNAAAALPMSIRQSRALGRLPHRPAPVAPPAFGPTGNYESPPATDAIAALPKSSEQRAGPRLLDPRNCYVCKQDFFELHSFYASMCPRCADFNWLKRIQTADLTGRVALVTGGRIKIGYQSAIKLLRAGAHVIVSTRFPRDAATRFANEVDFGEWSDRVEIHGLDLRHTPSVEAFTQQLQQQHSRLDFILNNACQTVRRPPSFYAHMIDREEAPASQLPQIEQQLLRGTAADNRSASPLAGLLPNQVQWREGLDRAASLSQIPMAPDDHNTDPTLFPEGKLDQDLQQVDLRQKNSWRLALDEVPAVELLEVHLVNAVAPFILNARLKELMLRTPGREKHIVNVSAMEGQFYRTFKTDKHPHTNMAKASLNMLTRTSAPDYIKDGIHMNSVDTGWITDEDPTELAERKTEEHGFHPPLDIVDAAARICDPILSGVNLGSHVWGQFLKDYSPTDW